MAAGDQTALESRESLIKWVVAAGTFLSVCASLWAGYLFTGRLIKQLQHLAAATSSGNGGESVTINPEDYPPDEIGQLATALKHDRERRTEALIREKAFSAKSHTSLETRLQSFKVRWKSLSAIPVWHPCPGGPLIVRSQPPGK